MGGENVYNTGYVSPSKNKANEESKSNTAEPQKGTKSFWKFMLISKISSRTDFLMYIGAIIKMST